MATVSSSRSSFLHGRWTVDDSARLYGLREWGKGYFGVNPEGQATVLPTKNAAQQASLFEIVDGLRERGIYTPVLLRFNDILSHRLREIRKAFDDAMTEQGYTGGYSCVYPIKVNQQRHISEQIAREGAQLGFGLEAGSKPELLAVLGLTTVSTAGRNGSSIGLTKDGRPEAQPMPIICNGFKDDEFIETVILAHKLGRNIIPVVEQFHELELIVKHAKAYGVRPRIGLRAKLSSRGAGRWESSSGIRSKFGLFVSQIMEAVEYLKANDMLDCLTMVHCHVGSQVFDIRQIKNAVNELAHIYCELHRLGAGMTTLDVGGGMGIDYDGSQSAWDSSINYTVNEYAADIVYRIKSVCDQAGVPHPMIITESGRAMVAYSSVLVFDVLGAAKFDTQPDLEAVERALEAEMERPQPVVDLLDAYRGLSDRNLMEVYHDALQARDEANSLFSLGYMSLPMRGAAEKLFWAIGRKLLDRASKLPELPEEFEDLPNILSDIYFCNFSLFQSMPDSWAIDQLFPIMPIHRLHEEPTRRGVLADITCDSDGKVDHFVDKRIDKRMLELHELRKASDGSPEAYYLGVFLLGAYQEILGDLHNLLGDTHAVHVSIADDGAWEIDEVVEGDTVEEVLQYVQYDVADLKKALRQDVEAAQKQGRLTVAEGKSLLKFYDDGLEGYTYLEGDRI